MKYVLLSHCNGKEEVPVEAREEVAAAIEQLRSDERKISAKLIRDGLVEALLGCGWSAEVQVSSSSDMTITSTKRGVGLCLQTGNMARMYADMMKLQSMYISASINSAIIIVPSPRLAKELGDNIAQADRLERELRIFRKVYFAPTLVFGLE